MTTLFLFLMGIMCLTSPAIIIGDRSLEEFFMETNLSTFLTLQAMAMSGIFFLMAASVSFMT